ncbi:MAG: exonuclease subunit SbcD [Bacteroidia bacterium]|nr:exonuclease subunit SbcD [Bacteroidia bacterium]
MKILHTADWHLGKKLDMLSRLEEQRAVLEEICQLSGKEEPNAVIIAGDIFDTPNPPIEALELFYKTAKRLTRNGKCAVIGIAGNHDSPDRIEAPDPLARECGIILTGYPDSVVTPFTLDTGLAVTHSEPGFISLRLPGCDEPLRVILTPYANESRLKTYLSKEKEEENLRVLMEEKWRNLSEKYCSDNKGVNLLVTHLFVMKKGEARPEEGDEERSVLTVGGAQEFYSDNFPTHIHYVALGHIHRPQTISKIPCPIVYSGSPIAYSMAESGQQKNVVIIEASPESETLYRFFPLNAGKKLYKKSFTSVEEAETWLLENPDSIVEVTIITDTALTPAQRKKLYQANPAIFLRLELRSAAAAANQRESIYTLDKSMEELFREYYQYKYQQQPASELMSLFMEVLHSTENEE